MFRTGEVHGRITQRAEEIRRLVGYADSAKVTANLWGERWSKLVANVMGNGLSACTGLPGGEILDFMEAARRAGIDFLLTRHEAAASFMCFPVDSLPDWERNPTGGIESKNENSETGEYPVRALVLPFEMLSTPGRSLGGGFPAATRSGR